MIEVLILGAEEGLVVVDRGLCVEIGEVWMGEVEVHLEDLVMVLGEVVGIHGIELLGDNFFDDIPRDIA
tara:strand:+ start:91 stop:297 length:207 start_codon:yes stop_codon:yes gene_type:complete